MLLFHAKGGKTWHAISISYTLHQVAVTRVEVSVPAVLMFFLTVTVQVALIDHIEQKEDRDAKQQLRSKKLSIFLNKEPWKDGLYSGLAY